MPLTTQNIVGQDPYGVGQVGQIPPITSAAQPAGMSGPTAVTGSTSSASGGTDGGAGAFDWGQILSGLGNIIGSPLVSAGTLIGLGESAASQQQSQTAGLTSQLTTPAQPFVQGGVSELKGAQQGLTGAPVQGGSIGQQEQVAQQFGNVAQQYSTGQLTTAQQQQIAQQTAAQKQNIRQQLASQGITDSSVLAMYDQEIDNNAAQMTQQLTQGNLQIAQQAQQAVQQTYSNLINDSIAQFGAGMGPIEDAINLTVQQNTQIAQGLQNLFGQIARGFAGATAGGGSATAGISKGIGQIGNQLSNLFGGNTGALTSDINSTIGAADSSLLTDLNASTAAQEGSVASDVASSNMDWLTGGGFSPAGGGAAGTAGAAGGAADALTPAVLGDYSFAPSLSGVGTGAVDAATAAAQADVTAAVGGGAADAAAGEAASSAGSAGGAGLAAALPYAAGALAVAAPFYGLTQPSYTLTGAYYDRLNQTFSDTISKGPSDPNFMYNYSTLMASDQLSPEQKQQLQDLYSQATSSDMAQRALWVQQAGGTPPPGWATGGGGGGGPTKAGKN